MVTGIIGRKVGMTQVFDAGRHRRTRRPSSRPGPCVVVQAKTRADRRLRGGAARPGRRDAGARSSKPLAGHYKKADVPPTRVRREVKLAPGGEALKAGDQVLVVGMFADGERVDVIGISRGKGFQGVVKRHNFRGGAATHGSMFHRAPGSIGASSFPSRVVKGMRAAGRMGGDRVTTRNLKVRAGRRREQPAARPTARFRARRAATWSSARRSPRKRSRSRRSRSRARDGREEAGEEVAAAKLSWQLET